MTADRAPAFERGAWSARGALFLFVIAEVAFFVVGSIVVRSFTDSNWLAKLAHEIISHSVIRWTYFFATPTALFVSVFARTIAALALVLGFRRWLAPSASPASFGFERPAVGMLSMGMLAGIALVIIDIVVGSLQASVFGYHASIWTSILANHHGTAAYLLDVSSGALISPVAEELIFRGLLFTALVQRTPVWMAVVLSSALFAAGHFQPYGFVGIFVIGAGFALLYYKTRNIWVTIAAHGTYNFVVFSLYFLTHH